MDKKQYLKLWREKNIEKIRERDKIYYQNNKKEILAKNKLRRDNNKEYGIIKAKNWAKNNPEKRKAIVKKWYEKSMKNPESKKRMYLNTKRCYDKKRKNDPLFKLKCRLRSELSIVVKEKGLFKRSKTLEYLGIGFDQFLKYIEGQFKNGMSWENYGDWHIDHIIPVSSIKKEEDIKYIFHYSNMRPLWANENILKKDKIPQVQLIMPL